MTRLSRNNFQHFAYPAIIVTALIFAYWTVIVKLGFDWWSDENYSHGLLVPFVIGMIIWSEWGELCATARRPRRLPGLALIFLSMVFLAAGTVGAELFTQRVSLVLMLAGVVIYFFGEKLFSLLGVSFALLLLAIPIPQILLNKIAFPLQIWASQLAVWTVRLFDVPVVRNGNILDILPRGSTQTISLEVVEACSGIRSLSTLITLALILAYVTRGRDSGGNRHAGFHSPDIWRAGILMVLAVPIAVLTNAGRVAATGIGTYIYGKPASEGMTHELSGWLVYLFALSILIGANYLLQKAFPGPAIEAFAPSDQAIFSTRKASVWPIAALIVLAGLGIGWYSARGEITVTRSELSELPRTLGEWQQRGADYRFDPETESVLGATDYSMREYTYRDGRVANIYVGYYASQRTGATYHSPQNCLPGAGWVLKDPGYIDIPASNGRVIRANRYVIENGIYREVMIYWYEGRGRTEASEYIDRLNTVIDSISLRRTDGAMIRVMTGIGSDEAAATKAAVDIAAELENNLTPFVPK
jgi:exosortase D (VPLPA-CTERM-specific)